MKKVILYNLETAGRNLKPLSGYDGKLLKLTKGDKTKIAGYESQIAQYECDILDLRKKITLGMILQTDYWQRKIDLYQFRIDSLRELIREIKINRFNRQKSK